MRVEAEFEGVAGTVRSAREFVAGTLAAWDLDQLDETACLLTSELAANAVRHAGGAYRLIIEWKPPELRIEVVDSSAELPHPHAPALEDETGKGLLLVAALAHTWGAGPVGRGKSVWFALMTKTPNCRG